MGRRSFRIKLSSSRIILAGFLGTILLGALLLALPLSSRARQWTSFRDALFTSTSAVCVTGLVVHDTATYWSVFGQAVILLLIQIGGLGVISVAAFLAGLSGRRISLLQRSMLQDTISAHQIGGIVRMTGFLFRTVFLVELAGTLLLLPAFCRAYGPAGIWMAVFHAVSAFCNAGFDIMGSKTGPYSSLTAFRGHWGIVLPICLLILIGGLGYLTWDDIAVHRHRLRKYRMQSKAILLATLLLTVIPALLLFLLDFSGFPPGERIGLALFQAVTPRTAGFNTAELTAISGGGRGLLMALMLIGGAPGSTAGGIKTTTLMVLLANASAIFHRRKNARLFGRRIEDATVKTAAALLVLYLFLILAGAFVISAVEGLPFSACLFETFSAAGTVGLSLGITPSLGLLSHLILIGLMFFGRVGGLTLMSAAINQKDAEVAQCPVEKISVG